MALIKKILIGVGVILVLGVGINYGLNIWVKVKLPKIITENNDSPFKVSYKNIHIDLWSGSAKVYEIGIYPKNRPENDTIKLGIYATVKSIEIEHFKIWNVLFNNVIKAEQITVNDPNVLLYKNNENVINDSKNINSQIINPIQKIIIVPNIVLKNGSLKIIYIKSKKSILSARNINLAVNRIVITDETLKNKIPFSYEKFNFSTDSVFYQINQFYHLKAVNLQTSNSNFKLKNWALVPEYPRSEFSQKLKTEKDMYNINGALLSINNMDFGYKDSLFFFNANSLILEKMSANIYRNKTVDDDTTKKHLYNKLLRDIKFPLKVDTLAIKNSMLVYEEEVNAQRGPGKLTFNNFNLNATGIQSGFEQDKVKDVVIDVQSQFMNESFLKVHWTFNVLDKTDRFHIKGTFFNFNLKALYPFTKDYMKVSFKGNLEKVLFNFKGNDKGSAGDFALQYRDLEVKFYKKKKPNKENKLKTAVANPFIKNDSNGQTKKVKVEIERDQDRSFYNLLWKSIAEGLKKILI